MARKQDLLGVSQAETVIGTGVQVRGNLSSEGDISIDGKLAGNIKCGGNLSVGVNAHVAGDVVAVNISIGGRLDGNVKATETTSILETGQVIGDIATNLLDIAQGGIFIGQSKMKPPQASEVPTRPASQPTDSNDPQNKG